jgi:hypothetical protein
MHADLVVYAITFVILMFLICFCGRLWCSGKSTAAPSKAPRARREPKPFAGFTRKPDCPACEQEAEIEPAAEAPHAPPPRMIFTRGRRGRGTSSSPCSVRSKKARSARS